MNPKKVVITGGPSTGKTALINTLKSKGCICYDEISRQIILKAREDGIEQLFLTKPLLFSKKLLEGRIEQFEDASNEDECVVIIDRGLPDVLAYMDYIGDTYPQHFIDACKTYQYNYVFMLSPWQDIYVSDNERYESFEQAIEIHHYLLKTYKHFRYKLIDVPFESLENRANFILKTLNL